MKNLEDIIIAVRDAWRDCADYCTIHMEVITAVHGEVIPLLYYKCGGDHCSTWRDCADYCTINMEVIIAVHGEIIPLLYYKYGGDHCSTWRDYPILVL